MIDPAEFDAIVNDSRFAPFHGWHDDFAAGEPYLPAVQQVRSEFLALAHAAEGMVSGRALQLGLGHAGGGHRLLQRLFGEVLTVERDAGLVRQYLDRFGPSDIVVADTRDACRLPELTAAPFDFLFIDAGHLIDDVRQDFADYAPLVREGGLIAFHDAVQRGPSVEVHIFIQELLAAGRSITIVGNSVGTAWMTR